MGVRCGRGALYELVRFCRQVGVEHVGDLGLSVGLARSRRLGELCCSRFGGPPIKD